MTYPRLEKQFHNPCPWLHNNLLKTLENTRHRRKLSTSDARHTRCNMARTFVRTISITCEKKRQLNIQSYARAHHALWLSTRLFQRSGPTATRNRFLNFALARFFKQECKNRLAPFQVALVSKMINSHIWPLTFLRFIESSLTSQ